MWPSLQKSSHSKRITPQILLFTQCVFNPLFHSWPEVSAAKFCRDQKDLGICLVRWLFVHQHIHSTHFEPFAHKRLLLSSGSEKWFESAGVFDYGYFIFGICKSFCIQYMNVYSRYTCFTVWFEEKNIPCHYFMLPPSVTYLCHRRTSQKTTWVLDYRNHQCILMLQGTIVEKRTS